MLLEKAVSVVGKMSPLFTTRSYSPSPIFLLAAASSLPAAALFLYDQAWAWKNNGFAARQTSA